MQGRDLQFSFFFNFFFKLCIAAAHALGEGASVEDGHGSVALTEHSVNDERRAACDKELELKRLQDSGEKKCGGDGMVSASKEEEVDDTLAPWSQLLWLTKRAYMQDSRLPLFLASKFLQTILLGALIAGTFANLGDDQMSIQNRLGLFYFLLISQVFCNALGVVLTFSEEKMVFFRERARNLYRISMYFLAKSLVDVPISALSTILFTAICYSAGKPFSSFSF